MSAWELTNVTAQLVLPPGVFILLGLVGLAFARSHAKFGAALTAISLVSLYVLSTSVVSKFLVQSLEVPYSDPAAETSAMAIVVLGGGSYHAAPEYGADTVAKASLERARYAAYLHKRTAKPILATSGNPAGGETSEAEQIKQVLRDFGVGVKWVESRSNNTLENARMTQAILKKAGVQSVYLVTNAWHMPRARLAFERAGLQVIPAPMGYHTRVRLTALDFIPSAGAMNETYIFFHEVLGTVWYRLKFDLGR